MLKKSEIDLLGNHINYDHLIIDIEKIFISQESEVIRDGLNKGKHLTKEEIKKLPYSEVLVQENIKDKDDIQWLKVYSIEHGRDLQSLFVSNGFSYLTLFIDENNINHEFKELLSKYNLVKFIESNLNVGIAISFPTKI